MRNTKDKFFFISLILNMSSALLPVGYNYDNGLKNELLNGSAVNWISIAPRGSLTVGPSGQFDFEHSSQNQFAALNVSYLKYDIVLTKTTPNTACDDLSSPKVGMAGAVIDSVRTSLNGREVENLEGYGSDLHSTYSTVSDEKKQSLAALEHYGVNVLNSTSDRITVIHYLNSAFHASQPAFPLPFCNIQLSIKTNPLSEIAYATGTVTNSLLDYHLENMSWNVQMATPNPLFLAQMFTELEQGKMVKIRYPRKYRYIHQSNGSTYNSVPISTGQCQSLRSIKMVIKRAKVAAAATPFGTLDPHRHTHAGLASFHFSPSNGHRIPISRDWTVQEVFPLALSQYTNPLNPSLKIDYPNWTASDGSASEFRISYNFRPDATDGDLFHGDGLEISQGWMNANLTFGSALDASSQIHTYASIDTELSLGRGTVTSAVFF